MYSDNMIDGFMDLSQSIMLLLWTVDCCWIGGNISEYSF